MSIKDLFEKKSKSLPISSLSEISEDVESIDYIREKIVDQDLYIPDVDFSEPKNFVKFGSAQKYYVDAIERIYNNFPFDGSLKEKQQFHNSSSYLDKFVFENWYPRTTGYAKFSPLGWGTQLTSSTNNFGLSDIKEYIKTLGVMGTGSIYHDDSNVYNISKNRTANLKIDGSSGNTIEFWLNKGAIVTAKTQNEVIFDLWNGATVSHAAGSTYGRFLVYLNGSSNATYPDICLTYVSGTVNSCTDQTLGYAKCDNIWNHYAIVAKNIGNDLQVKLFLNGSLSGSSIVTNGAIGEVTGSLISNIGAIRTKNTPTDNADIGYGKLSGSIDEFRFWKVARNNKEIYNNWFSQIGVEGRGGTNSDDSNTDLGVYYKFNEGITTDSSLDTRVLDYSGRVSDGYWVGYSSNSRSTGSALIDYGLKEYKDPIIYSTHPDVSYLYNEKLNSGSIYDVQNNSSFYNSFPSWITEEDQRDDKTGHLLKLSQVASSYLDTLFLQINELPRIKEAKYLSGSFQKPLPFANRLLESLGFDTSEIFSDVSPINRFLKSDNNLVFDDDIVNIKNMIYTNIYNNLSYIYKSKGTEKAFRNLIRCFGIDDDLIKINFYGNNVNYTLDTKYNYKTVKTKCVDLNNVDRFNGTVFQASNSYYPNVTSFLSGSSNLASGSAMTFETEVMFPKKFKEDEYNYFETPFVQSSLFGVHSANSGIGWISPDYDFQVSVIKDKVDSKRAYFQLTSSYGKQFPLLTSSLYQDVYNNQKWNFAVKIKPSKYPLNTNISGTLWDTYDLEFYGANTTTDYVLNSFLVSSSLTFNQGSLFLASPKRFYVGAHLQDFTSSVLHHSDVKILSSRVWFDYLSNDAILAHAYDFDNYGVERPYENLSLMNPTLNNVFVPKIDTLALHWDFNTITGSDSSGNFWVDDIHSCSNTSTIASNQYNWLGNITKVLHTGKGYNFPVNSSNVYDVEYVFSAKQKLPEILDSSNMVEILERDDTTFTRDTRPIDFYTIIEKSMYQTISEQMINMFGTIKDFNNLIGEPVNYYRHEYKDLKKLKELFYQKVQNTPDIEQFIEFYKWIDSSLSKMIQQLIPISANVSNDISDVVESHILERNKFRNKYPTLEMKWDDPESGAKGVNELTYNWKYGHKPISNLQKDNCLYWNRRALRSDPVLSASSMLASSRNYILLASSSSLEREFSTPYKFSSNESNTIYNGVNFPRNKKIDYIKGSLIDGFGLQTNQFIISASSITKDIDCQDGSDLNKKIFLNGKVLDNKDLNNIDYAIGKSNILLPFNIVSSSVNSGYITRIRDQFLTGTDFVNLHSDTYGDDKEIPMQSPFTERWVGGLQHRHYPYDGLVTVNEMNRGEGWKLKFDSTNKVVYIRGSELSFSGSNTVPKVMFYREELAKRPINIKNIKNTNYSKEYEIVQTSGRKYNNKALVVSGSFGNTFTGSSYIYGFSDYLKPERGNQKHVFVERFSAPGGPETAGDSNGGMGLDIDSAEYSVYNSINYRNLLVRTPLNTLSTRYCGQFGTDSERGGVYPLTYETNASYHKTNRNPLERIVFSGSNASYQTEYFMTSSKYDNWFIQHPIPQDDSGYAWITASCFLSGSNV